MYHKSVACFVGGVLVVQAVGSQGLLGLLRQAQLQYRKCCLRRAVRQSDTLHQLSTISKMEIVIVQPYVADHLYLVGLRSMLGWFRGAILWFCRCERQGLED